MRPLFRSQFYFASWRFCPFTILLIFLIAFSQPLQAREIEFFHTAIDETKEGDTLELSANAPFLGDIQRVLVYLSLPGQKKYKIYEMKRLKGDYYEVRISGKILHPPQVFYFIVGRHKNGRTLFLFASPKHPQKIKVLPATKRDSLGEELSIFGAETQIYSAARRKQRITESPSAITVLHHRDILNVGATSLAAILRQVPGMDVMFITRADPNLSIRGFNREGANKLLTLVDGRSVYVDLFGITFWETLAISILEIDRIEVIRGPGSSLYGANAFGGVVNIYTISPEKFKGFRYIIQSGFDGLYGTFVGGGHSGHDAYRVSSTYSRFSSFENYDQEGMESAKGYATWLHRFGKRRLFQFTGSFSKSKAKRIQTLFGSFRVDASQGAAKLNFQHDDFKIQFFWSLLKADLGMEFPLPKILSLGTGKNAPKISLKDIGIERMGPEKLSFEAHTIDLEPQYVLEYWQGKGRLVLGGNFRLIYSKSDELKLKEYTQTLGSLFLQLEFKPSDWFILSAGGRFDWRHTTIDGQKDLSQVSPHGAMIFKLHKDHTIRLTAGLSFRNPAFLESGIELELVPGKKVNDKVIPPLEFKGEKNLLPEKLLSLEAGYSGRLFRRILINIDAYYQKVTDLILFEGDVSELFNYFLHYTGLLAKPPKTAFTFNNDLSAWSIGGEVSVRFLITKWLHGFANYAYQRIFIAEVKGVELKNLCQPGYKCPALIDEDTPQHKVNFGIHLHYQWFRFNFYGHYVHETRRINFLTRLPNAKITNPLSGEKTFLKNLAKAEAYNIIPSYFLLNLNASFALWDKKLELGFSIRNLIGLLTGGFGNLEGDGFIRDKDKIIGIQQGYHVEYPRLNLFGTSNGGELIGGRIYLFLRGKI